MDVAADAGAAVVVVAFADAAGVADSVASAGASVELEQRAEHRLTAASRKHHCVVRERGGVAAAAATAAGGGDAAAVGGAFEAARGRSCWAL